MDREGRPRIGRTYDPPMLLALDIAQRNTNELLRATAELSIGAEVANLDHHLRPAGTQVEFLANQLGAGAVPLDDDGDGLWKTFVYRGGMYAELLGTAWPDKLLDLRGRVV